ncbi:hypothetical protein ACOJAM_08645 [Corynebacterium striatum]|uniref:hypothetical protein n=1 Tax=Corynebacterium striatum TaxID=43770 RepID=UPI003B5C1AE9
MIASNASAYSEEQWQELEDQVFNGDSAALTAVRDYARHNHLPPVPFLVACAQYAIAATPSSVMLDAGLGPGTANMFVCLMDAPGMGKDRLMKYVRRAMNVSCNGKPLEPAHASVSSGEGVITSMIEHDEKGNPIVEDGVAMPGAPVLFGVSEVGLLGNLMQRQGNTLRQNLLSVYSGNPLGINNRQDKMYLAQDSYRGCLWVGAQPDTAGILLEGGDDGLRHRFVFVELEDPLLDIDHDYPEAQLLPVEIPKQLVDSEPFTFPREVCQYSQLMLKRKLKHGAAVAPVGHADFTTAKLAMGIALLRSQSSASRHDYDSAKAIMDYSAAVIARCERHQSTKRIEDRAARRGEDEQAAELAAEQRVKRKEEKRQRLVGKIVAWVDVEDGCSPEPETWQQFRQTLNSRDRSVADFICGQMIHDGVLRRDGERVERGPAFQQVV